MEPKHIYFDWKGKKNFDDKILNVSCWELRAIFECCIECEKIFALNGIKISKNKRCKSCLFEVRLFSNRHNLQILDPLKMFYLLFALVFFRELFIFQKHIHTIHLDTNDRFPVFYIYSYCKLMVRILYKIPIPRYKLPHLSICMHE
jgi:hypothetical protein